jgi:hypothetical protein
MAAGWAARDAAGIVRRAWSLARRSRRLRSCAWDSILSCQWSHLSARYLCRGCSGGGYVVAWRMRLQEMWRRRPRGQTGLGGATCLVRLNEWWRLAAAEGEDLREIAGECAAPAFG